MSGKPILVQYRRTSSDMDMSSSEEESNEIATDNRSHETTSQSGEKEPAAQNSMADDDQRKSGKHDDILQDRLGEHRNRDDGFENNSRNHVRDGQYENSSRPYREHEHRNSRHKDHDRRDKRRDRKSRERSSSPGRRRRRSRDRPREKSRSPDRLREKPREKTRTPDRIRDKPRDKSRSPRGRSPHSRHRSRSPGRRDRKRSHSPDHRRRGYKKSSRSPESFRSKRLERKAARIDKLGLELFAEAKPGSMLGRPSMPGFVNSVASSRLTEQIQKRRQLWTANKKEEESAAAGTSKAWESATFKGDNDGKMTEKFKRLMGIKAETETAPAKSGTSIIQKQEEMFSNMEAQYQVARMATHTHRGIGLGFGTFQVPPR